MTIISEKFLQHKWNFFWQPLLASIFVVVTLIVLGGIQHINLLGYIGTGSLGSSAFLVFCLPQARSARSGRLLGGYCISMLSGIIFSALICHLKLFNGNFFTHYCTDITAVIAMTVAIFSMVFFRMEHPPAVGFVLGLIMDNWTYKTLIMIIAVILLLTIVKLLLKPWLVNLV